MYCSKCGTNNEEDAVYCKKCGLNISANSESLSGKNSGTTADPEAVLIVIRPTLKFVKFGYIAAVFSAFLIVAIFSILSRATGFLIPPWVAVLIGFALLLIPAYYHLKQRAVKYTLTDSKVTIEHGLLSKTARNVPLGIIQDVTVSRNFVQRVLGFGDIEIENANEQDAQILLNNVDSPQQTADRIMNEMRKRNKTR